MITLTPNGTDDTEQLQNAADNHTRIHLNEGTFITDEVTFQSGTMLTGSHKYGTTIKPLMESQQSVVNIKNKNNVTLRDFGIDCGVTEHEYTTSGTYGILASTGNGYTIKTTNITLENLWLRNFKFVAVCPYGGLRQMENYWMRL